VVGRQAFFLGFDERHGDGLRFRVDLDAESIIHAAPAAAASFPANDLDRACRLLAANEVFDPAP
jgi:hypothetical protein